MGDLSRDFDSSRIPGWHRYSPEVRARVAELVKNYLQPIRRRWGTVIITSGYRTTGTHNEGALDWVPIDALREGYTLQEVAEWGATYLPGTYGETIVEPVPWGGDYTGHNHTTPPGIGDPGTGQLLLEVGPGEYVYGHARSALLVAILGVYLLGLAISTLATGT